jgi:hypothetical protein
VNKCLPSRRLVWVVNWVKICWNQDITFQIKEICYEDSTFHGWRIGYPRNKKKPNSLIRILEKIKFVSWTPGKNSDSNNLHVYLFVRPVNRRRQLPAAADYTGICLAVRLAISSLQPGIFSSFALYQCCCSRQKTSCVSPDRSVGIVSRPRAVKEELLIQVHPED